jgi:hypothetical protein
MKSRNWGSAAASRSDARDRRAVASELSASCSVVLRSRSIAASEAEWLSSRYVAHE